VTVSKVQIRASTLEISLAERSSQLAGEEGRRDAGMLPGKLGHRKGVYPLRTSAILPRLLRQGIFVLKNTIAA